MSSLQEQYQADRRQISASGIYRVPAPANRRPSIYADTPAYLGLGSYTRSQQSKFLPKPGQSDQDYTSKLRPLLAHLAESLPADELALVTEAYKSAEERLQGGQTHAQLREQLDNRNSGTGVGVMGAASAQARGAIVGSRFGGRSPVAQGSLAVRALYTPGQGQPMTAADAYAIARQRDAERQGQQPQRQEIPAGSSGTGWTGVSR